MTIALSFIKGEFVEKSDPDAEAVLVLTPNPNGDGQAELTFKEDAGLITRRTATRQAQSICATGFLLGDGSRVGARYTLKVVEGDKLSEAHTRVGHEYNRV